MLDRSDGHGISGWKIEPFMPAIREGVPLEASACVRICVRKFFQNLLKCGKFKLSHFRNLRTDEEFVKHGGCDL